MVTVVVLLVVAIFFGTAIAKGVKDSKPDPATGVSPAQARARQLAAQQATVVCPHCQARGGVTWKEIKRKQGISGAKATGAVLTGGLSVVATGLSRKGFVRACSCRNCGMKWDVA